MQQMQAKQKKEVAEEITVHAQHLPELERAAAQAGRTLEQHIAETESVSLETVADALAQALGMPYTQLDRFDLSPELARTLTQIMPHTTHTVIFDIDEKAQRVKIATRPAQRDHAVAHIAQRSGMEVESHLATSEQLKTATERYHRRMDEWLHEHAQPEDADGRYTPDHLVHGANSAPVQHVLDALLAYALFHEADEIRLRRTHGHAQARIMVEAAAVDAVELPVQAYAPLEKRIELLGGPERSWSQQVDEAEVGISTHAETVGEDTTTHLHIAARPHVARSLEQLGMSPVVSAELRHALSRPGLIIVGGERHSGRTTTAYALLEEVDTQRTHVALVEQRREHRRPGTTQIDVSRLNETMAETVERLHNADVDVLIIDSVRNAATAQAAVRHVRAGRTVVAVCTGTDTRELLQRWVSWVDEPALFASSVELVVAQLLVGTVPLEHRRSVALSSELTTQLQKSPSLSTVVERLQQEDRLDNELTVEEMNFYEGHGAGDAGRIAVHEVYRVDEEAKRTIGLLHQQVGSLSTLEPTYPFLEDAFLKARFGEVQFGDFHRMVDHMDSKHLDRHNQ